MVARRRKLLFLVEHRFSHSPRCDFCSRLYVLNADGSGLRLGHRGGSRESQRGECEKLCSTRKRSFPPVGRPCKRGCVRVVPHPRQVRWPLPSAFATQLPGGGNAILCPSGDQAGGRLPWRHRPLPAAVSVHDVAHGMAVARQPWKTILRPSATRRGGGRAWTRATILGPLP